MNPNIRRVLGESAGAKDTPMQVIEATKPTSIHLCPHCRNEIFEKHTYIEGDPMGEHIERHSDCGGAIKWPPADPATVEYMRKHWGVEV